MQDLYQAQTVYRPENNDYGGHDYDEEHDGEEQQDSDEPTFEIVQGADIQIDLSKQYRTQHAVPRSPNPSYSPSHGLSGGSPGRDDHQQSHQTWGSRLG